MSQLTKRDPYIDVIKGIAAIGVILIHTAFHSGYLYASEWTRFLVLFVDVPIFFLVSGLTTSLTIHKLPKRLLKLYLSYAFFIFFVTALDYIFGAKDYIGYRFLSHLRLFEIDSFTFFQNVSGSMWYMNTYFLVIPIFSCLLSVISRNATKALLVFLLISLIVYPFVKSDVGENITCIGFLSLYGFVFVLGFFMKNITISKKNVAIFMSCSVILLFAFCYAKGFEFWSVQGYKFPPHIIYLIVSSFSLLIVLGLRGRWNVSGRKYKGLAWLGENSIFIYFAQGISSSILYPIVAFCLKQDFFPWYILFVLMFLLNLTMALMLLYPIKKWDSIMWKCVHFIKNKIG